MQMRVWCFKSLIMLMLLLSVVPFSWAMSTIKRDFNELVALSDRVFIGTVDHMQSAWGDALKQDVIYTFVTFRDIEAIKGEVGEDNYTVRVAGGSLPPYSVTIPGAPQFSTNERYILFVKDNNHVWFPFVGGDQGIFRIDILSTGYPLVKTLQGKVVTQILGDEVVAEPDPGKSMMREKAMSLDEFKAQVRKRLNSALSTTP